MNIATLTEAEQAARNSSMLAEARAILKKAEDHPDSEIKAACDTIISRTRNLSDLNLANFWTETLARVG